MFRRTILKTIGLLSLDVAFIYDIWIILKYVVFLHLKT